MAVDLNTDSKNGSKNIDISRQATNQSNLDEAMLLWQNIKEIDEDKHPDYKDFKANSMQYHNFGKKFCKDLQKLVSETIPSRLTKNYIHYGLESPDCISWKEIKEMALKYENADPWLQINFCMDSTRQSVDEKVQRKMLNEDKEIAQEWNFKKCSPTKYVYGGKLLDSKQYKKSYKRKSIDTLGEHKDGIKKIWIFQKYAKVSGGHQDNVDIETKHFLEDAYEYVTNNFDNNYFIAQLDGAYIEGKLDELRVIYSSSKNVYAGNTEGVIEWISKISPI